MKKEHKSGFVSSLSKQISAAEANFLVEFKGLNVTEVNLLRSKLRKDNALVKVGKARLIKIAANDASCPSAFISAIKGQVAVVLTSSNSTVVAKSLVDFRNELKEKFALVAGVYLDQSFDSTGLESLGRLPSKEVLLSQLAGSLLQVIAGLARVLAEVEKKKVV